VKGVAPMAAFRDVFLSFFMLLAGSSAAMAADLIAVARYDCADGKTIDATYYSDGVDIVLSDGRVMSLAQTVSGSGARYANADESVVFWNKGNDAFITEGDPNNPIYADCVGEK